MLYSVDDSDDGALDRFKTKVQIKSSGTLMWMAPKIVSSSCKFDVTYFPFDRQVNFIEKFTISYLTIILRNRAEYRLILSRRGRRPSRLKSDDIPRD